MMKGGGSGGGITIYNILLFYLVFLLFIGFLSIQAGVSIVTVGGNPSDIPIPTFNILNPLATIVSSFNFFAALLVTNSTYQIFTVIFVTPFIVLLLYALLQLARGTG
jgi:hypothetical protein